MIDHVSWGQSVSKTGKGIQMSKTVAALSGLISSADDVASPPTSYLMGQLAAELVASKSAPDLSDAIVAIKDAQQNLDQENVSPLRQSVLAMMSGLLQGVLADQQTDGRRAEQLTVRERVLNLLAIGPRNPKNLTDEIGCSPETVSRALTRLSDVGLVDSMESPEQSDRRIRTYYLTPKGEKRQDDRFFGQLADDEGTITDVDAEDQDYDYGRVLVPLTEVVGELNTHAPAIAAVLYPGLDKLADRVEDEDLRAAAINELGASYRSNPDVASAQQSR
jgi:DNA-binding MarR family transcriptional regulator